MGSIRSTAVGVGILFVVATAAPIASLPLVGPILGPDGLRYAAENSVQVGAAALLELIMAVAIVAIAVLMYPILRTQSERAAVGYVGARVVEGVIFVVVAVTSLRLLQPLGRQVLAATAAEASSYRVWGTLLVAAHDDAYLIAGRFVFSLSALILNYSLFRSRAIPRWLSLWGLGGAFLLLSGAVFGVLGLIDNGSAFETISFPPIALQEMVFAVWLIAKGFRTASLVGT